MPEQIPARGNPFSEQGVSKYPPVTPLVGQFEAHQRIKDLLEIMREETGSCFRAIFGDWGIGKTRLAHELIAEVCGQSKGWIVRDETGQARKKWLLRPLHEDGILPIFTTFADILQAPEEGIDLRRALPKAACVAIEALAENRGKDYQVQMASDLQRAILTINPHFDFEELSEIAGNPELPVGRRANQAFTYLQQNTVRNGQPAIRKLLIIVDEIETASEFTPANTAEERRVQEYPVEALDIKNIFSAVKEEAGQATLPHISFLLLCSPGVRRISYIEASARRLKEAQLDRATGEDLDQLLEALSAEGYLSDYPGDLAAAAFLAADRNFGWFSYIMHPIYRLLATGRTGVQDYAALQQVSGRIGKIFRPQLVEGLNVSAQLKGYLRSIVYHQIPTSLAHLGIPEPAWQELLSYTDPYGIRVVGEVYPVQIDGDTFIRELRATGNYREESANSTKLIGEASTPFDPRDLLAKFSTFESREDRAILIFASSSEFASQIRFLTSDDLSDRTISTIHSILENHQLKTAARQIGPTVAFLLKFNERWAGAGAHAWLSDQQWEDLGKQIKDLSTNQVRQQVCLGTAKTLFDILPMSQKTSGIKAPHVALKLSESDNLNLTKDNTLIILYAHDASTAISDLAEVNRTVRGPVLLIFPNDDELRKWQQELATTHNQHLAVLAIPRVVDVGGREHDFVLHYAYRDEKLGFPAGDVRERGSQQRREYEKEWKRAIDVWFDQIEAGGYLLQPITEQSKYTTFRKAYGYLVAGKTRDQLAQLEGGHPLRQAIDNYLMQSGHVLKLFSDNTGALYFPNVFARILSLLATTPLKADDVSNYLFYRRAVAAGFNAPKPANIVVEQALGLLEELGLVEKDPVDSRYATLSAQRLGAMLTQARNQLGDFGAAPSNFVKDLRGLSTPFQQLAFKLRINEDQLKLLSTELESARQQLQDLDLKSQMEVPARQEAFLAVAGRVKQLRQTAMKVYRGSGDTPPAVDPNTLTDNVERIAQDTDHSTYSIKYRLDFLKDIDRAIKEKRDALQKSISGLQSRVQSSYRLNSDGTAFPTGPIGRILDLATQDIEGKEVVVSADLRTEGIGANLRTYMMAGELDKAFRRLSLYDGWISETDEKSLWNRFVRAYNQWQDVCRMTATLGKSWQQLEAYYSGDPDRPRMVSSTLDESHSEVVERVRDFARQFAADYPSERVEDLTAEVEATSEAIESVIGQADEALARGQQEIRELIDQTAYAALCRLAERMRQPPRVSEQVVWDEPRHIDQHNKVNALDQRARERGGDLLGDSNWLIKYLEVFRDVKKGSSSKDWQGREEVLHVLQEKGAVDLRIDIAVSV